MAADLLLPLPLRAGRVDLQLAWRVPVVDRVDRQLAWRVPVVAVRTGQI